MNRFYFWLKNALNLSTTEANGFVMLLSVLMFILSGIFVLKYVSPHRNTEIMDQLALESLLAEIEANAAYDSVATVDEPRYTYAQRRETKRPKADGVRPNMQKERKKDSFSFHSAIAEFDINKADTIQLKKLRGIGTVLSRRIVKYRDILGGFVSKEQLKEVYGLQDSVILQLDSLVFVAADFIPRYIEINDASEYELKRHPYINRRTAQSITTYRFQHGNFISIDDLHTLHVIDSLTLARIKPYIRF